MFGHAESLDCTVANADAAFLGVLSEVQGRTDPEATLTVEETLKGEHRDRLRVRFSAGGRTSRTGWGRGRGSW